jgi:nondiscriminating glutamyl-tRNA synthetase
MEKPIRVRFAPSPTGSLHIGSLRSALFNYLFAKHNNGKFILRIEDTDQRRTVPGSIEEIITTLNNYGLIPDEGPQISNGEINDIGPHVPYIQSKRLKKYKNAVNKLVEQGSAYPCFCSPDRLKELRESQEKQHLPPGYDGKCRSITSTEAQKRIAENESCIIRFRTPHEGQTAIHDLIRGQINFSHTTLEDVVLFKADGFPTYHLANVVDDHDMEISHVIRAEEWLPSLPLHILLYQAFSWTPPEFAHVSHILGPNKKKLSKRDGSVSAKDYLKDYLPNAILNFIALLGWNPKTNQEYFENLSELAKAFNLKQVNKAGAVFDVIKLNHLNRQHLQKMSAEEIAKAAHLKLSIEESLRYIPVVLDRLEKLSDLPGLINFLCNDELEYESGILVQKKETKATTIKILERILEFWKTLTPKQWLDSQELKTVTLEWILNQKESNSRILWPTRVALSGSKNSPDVFDIAVALGTERALKRLIRAMDLLR